MPNYHRVPSTEQSADTASTSDHDAYLSRRNPSERFQDKCVALAWVLTAVLLAYFTDFFTVLISSPKANRGLLQLVLICLLMNLTLVAYLTIYLPKVKGLTDSSAWPVYCPRVIPLIVIISFVAALLLIRATWPVWGFLSPLVLGIEMMGAIFSLHFIPWPTSLC